LTESGIHNAEPGIAGWVGGGLLLAAVALLQALALSRMTSVYETKRAEALPEGSPRVAAYLERAIATDPSFGWAYWLLSKEHLRLAQVASDRAQAQQKAREQAAAAGDERRRIAAQLAETEESQKRDEHLASAEALALQGAKSFSGVECYKQLASICLRRVRPEEPEEADRYLREADRYLQMVSDVKPGDIEVIERLGLIKLNTQKWDELRELCDRILRKHPYSANAYFYKAFLARQEKNRDEFYLNVRQAYLMMQQNTGTIFFDRPQLEEIIRKLNLAEPGLPAPPAAPPRTAP